MMRRPRCCYPARTAGYEIAVELRVLAVDVVPLDQRVQNGRRCICCLLSHSTTRTWASCQGLIPVWSACLSVLLRRFLWHAGSQKIICCVVQHTDKTNTNPLRLVDSLSHTRTKARPLHLNQPGAPGLPLVAEACLNLRSRLAATAAGQVPRIDDSPSDDPGCFTSKVKRSYPGPWLANAASPIIR